MYDAGKITSFNIKGTKANILKKNNNHKGISLKRNDKNVTIKITNKLATS
jgi:hypothetical protein